MPLRTKNLLIVIIGAFLVAILVALVVQMTIGGRDEPQQIVQEEKVRILVATKNLSMGDTLTAEDMRWQSWPKTTIFAGAIVRKDDQKPLDALEGRLARNVTKDEPLTKMSVLAADKGNFVAAQLEPGMRAVALEVTASSMAGGFIGPGDFVDVILTYKQSIKVDNDDALAKQLVNQNLDKLATETIAQNVQVVAIDQKATRPEDDKVTIPKTVTLAVNAQKAERIALAQEMGVLTLTLRGVGDEAVVEKDWETISDVRLTTVDDEIYEEYKQKKKDSGQNLQIMRVYNGDTVRFVPTEQ